MNIQGFQSVNRGYYLQNTLFHSKISVTVSLTSFQIRILLTITLSVQWTLKTGKVFPSILHISKKNTHTKKSKRNNNNSNTNKTKKANTGRGENDDLVANDYSSRATYSSFVLQNFRFSNRFYGQGAFVEDYYN